MAQTKSESTEGELLVWGYACKLFRDDEKAIHIDKGKHLIPWMGDDKLMIDRYDGRGALFDLASCEAKEGAWEDGLSAEEADIEKRCDRERYYSLFHADDETVIYQDEIAKRAQSKYGQVAYDYSEEDGGTPQGPEPAKGTEGGRAFVPPPSLSIPDGLTVPSTMRQHAIVVKTAAFIAQQGSQMEILMRLKQSGNKQFEFLAPSDTLHNYYKHLLSAIKSGSYVPSEEDISCLDDDEADTSDHYLHPSLAPADPSKPPPLIRAIVALMVKYITKNGLIFEEAIRKLNDSRFSFLLSNDTYYNYYRDQVTASFRIDPESIVEAEDSSNTASVIPADEPEMEGPPTKKKKKSPVCFSIKKPKDEGLEVASALPVEDSSDGSSSDSDTPLAPPPPIITAQEMRSKPEKADVDLQKERKAKVAQFLKGLKGK